MSEENTRARFKVINGGLSESAESSCKEFVSATITDTRLMGVVGMYVHWKLPDNCHLTHLHQFFYFDAEETGFDTYRSVLGCGDDSETEEILDVENYLLGGLGGRKINITQREARYMLQSYVALNLRSDLPLPGDTKEYEFMLSSSISLSDPESYVLMCKQCPQ